MAFLPHITITPGQQCPPSTHHCSSWVALRKQPGQPVLGAPWGVQGMLSHPSMGSTPQEWGTAARSCGHIALALLAGEAEESSSCHPLRGPQRWPVPTRCLSPSPAASLPLSLIKLQVNLPGSGPAPGAKRLPADPDLPPCTSLSMPGTACSPCTSFAHSAPSRQPLPLCKEPGSASHLQGCCPGPKVSLGEGLGDGDTHRDEAEHPKHLRVLQGQVGKALGLPGGTKIPASSPAAAVPGQALRSADTRAWLGLCRARRRGPELGSISLGIHKSTCLPQHVAKPPHAPVHS